MENVAIKLTKFDVDDRSNNYDVLTELEKFVGTSQECLSAYHDAMMFIRMMEIKSEARYLVERHMYAGDKSPLGKGLRYYLPECNLYLEFIIYNTGILHIECLKDVEDEDIDDDMEVFVTMFKIETDPFGLTRYISEPESNDNSDIQKILYWIEKGFGKILTDDDVKAFFNMKE
jgi:hypothetical protein